LKSPNWAEKTLKRLVALYPSDPVVYEASLNLGILHFHGQDYREAIASFKRATGSSDRAAASFAQLKIGDSYLALGDRESAKLEFMKVLYLYRDRDEYVGEALLKVGQIYVEEQRWSEARQIYQKLIRTARSEEAKEIARKMLKRVEKETSTR
jgi:tetratricopeptide (TPR) repeat protein